jgi:hypothetical protein
MKAEAALSAIGGVSLVVDEDQEQLEIKLTSGNGEYPDYK